MRRKEKGGENSISRDPGAGRKCHGNRKQAVWGSTVRCKDGESQTVGQTMGERGICIGHREDPSLVHWQVSPDFRRTFFDYSVDKHSENGLVLALVKCPHVCLQTHHTQEVRGSMPFQWSEARDCLSVAENSSKHAARNRCLLLVQLGKGRRTLGPRRRAEESLSQKKRPVPSQHFHPALFIKSVSCSTEQTQP